MKFQKGVTLIEVIVVVAIMAILASIAYPSYQRSLQSAEIKKVASSFEDGLALARISAIETNKRIVVCPLAADNQCGNQDDWKKGLLIFQDDNNLIGTSGCCGNLGGAKVVRQVTFDNAKVSVDIGSLRWIAFLGGGRRAIYSTGGAVPPKTIEIHYEKNNSIKCSLTFNALGRVSRGENCQ